MTECCTIDLTSGQSSVITLGAVASEIELQAAATEIELLAEASEIDLTAESSVIELTVNQVGIQGAPGTDGALPGFTTTNKQGSTIVAGTPVAVHSTGIGIVLADATTSAKPCVGLNAVDVNNLDAATVRTGGTFELADWTAITGTVELAPKAVYFLSTVAGMLTTSSPTTSPNISQRVGKSVSPTKLDIDPWGFVLL